MSPDSEALGVLAERVRRLEEDQQESRRALQQFSGRVDTQFEGLRALITSTIASIKYVDSTLYERDRKEMENSVAAAKADAERSIKIAWGIATVFAIPIVGMLGTVLMRVVS